MAKTQSSKTNKTYPCLFFQLGSIILIEKMFFVWKGT